MSTTPENLKLSQPSGLVELLEIDLRMFGGDLIRITPHDIGGVQYLTFGSQQYFSFPCEFKGSETNTTSLPRPTFTVAKVQNKQFLAAIGSFGDLVGMRLTRFFTYEKFLDTGSNPNPGATSPKELWVALQVSNHDKSSISWTMGLPIDNANSVFPPGQILKDAVSGDLNVYAPGLSRIQGW